MTRFNWPIRVYYEDTDSGGVVYYANYLRYMERARTEWLRQLGFEQDRLLIDDRLIFAVRRAEIDYLQPARFNDQLEVVTEVTKLGRASLTFIQTISKAEKSIPSLCRGKIQIAALNAETFRPCAIPNPIAEEIRCER